MGLNLDKMKTKQLSQGWKEILNKLIKSYYKYRILLLFLLMILITFWANSIIPNPNIPYGGVAKFKDNLTNETYFDSETIYSLNQNYLISGGNPFWNIMLLGNPSYQICFVVGNVTEDKSVFVSYNKKESVKIERERCFDVLEKSRKNTFNLEYNFNITIPNFPLLPPVNKSDCIPGTIDETSHTCLTEQSIQNAKTSVLHPPAVNIYFGLDKTSKMKKIIFLFVLSGFFLKELFEFILFFGGKKKK